MTIPKTYHLHIPGVYDCDLPVCQVAPGVHIAYLHLGNEDIGLTEAVAAALADRMPSDADVLVAPYGKGLGLYDALRKLTRLPGVVCPKHRTPDMTEGFLSASAVSITTPAKHDFHLSATGITRVQGRHAVVVDDIVSRGGTKDALVQLLTAAGAARITFMAVGTEGDRRDDVIALTHFPVFVEK